MGTFDPNLDFARYDPYKGKNVITSWLFRQGLMMFKFLKTSELSLVATQALPAQIICILEWDYTPINS